MPRNLRERERRDIFLDKGVLAPARNAERNGTSVGIGDLMRGG